MITRPMNKCFGGTKTQSSIFFIEAYFLQFTFILHLKNSRTRQLIMELVRSEIVANWRWCARLSGLV